MKTLAIAEFKAKCIAELRAVRETGEEIEITLRGRPVARVVPIREGGRKLGNQPGAMKIVGEIITSDLEDDFAPEKPHPARRRRRV